jgi:HD-GYP domain-containing protein (c-di-GMP phosphodiesterase class II)
VSDRELFRIARDFAEMVAVDLDLLPTILSLRSTPDDFLYQHCVSVSSLSMVIATQLGFRHERVLEIGLAGMLQDVGMLRVPVSIRLAPRALTESEREIIHRHPAYTVDYLDAIPSLPRDVRFVGYQVHERVDQTGYPRKRGGSTIHAYAKIIAVADVYIAMTSPRPYRPAHMPYEAATAILHDCGQGRFDNRIVRALLDCISLFPTGSYLELDDGRQAKVVRANPNRHTRPVVGILQSDGTMTGELIDLAVTTGIQVARIRSAPDLVHAGTP